MVSQWRTGRFVLFREGEEMHDQATSNPIGPFSFHAAEPALRQATPNAAAQSAKDQQDASASKATQRKASH